MAITSTWMSEVTLGISIFTGHKKYKCNISKKKFLIFKIQLFSQFLNTL